VIQGIYFGSDASGDRRDATNRCVQSVRTHFPKAEIILSTWQGHATITADVDLVLASEDPGALCPNDKPNLIGLNLNRQIVSTRNGLDKANRSLSIKLRSDALITGTHFADLYQQYRSWPARNFSSRVLISSLYTRDPSATHPFPFHYSDLYMMGDTADLRAIWSIPTLSDEDCYMQDPDTSTYYSASRHRMIGEQYVWITCCRRHHPALLLHPSDATAENVELSDRFLFDNFIIADCESDGVSHPHLNIQPDYRRSVYTFRDWKYRTARSRGESVGLWATLHAHAHQLKRRWGK
jgi:hypothetical protein